MVLTEEERKERKRISNKKQSEKRSLKRKEIREQKKIEKELNKELDKLKYNERKSKYNKSVNGNKIYRKTTWKFQGLNMENFEEIYERYTMAIFCDICECVLEGNGRNKKCMDHDHDTGEFRNIVCNYCNIHICK